MSNLGDLNFNAAAVEPASFDVLPAGWYEAVIVKSEVKATTNGKGKYLKLCLQIMNGDYQNRTIFDNLNLWNESAKAVQIAQGTFSALCRSVNVLTPRDSAELHGKPLRIKLAVTKSDEYGEQNQIKAYKPREAGPVIVPVPQMAGQQAPFATTAAAPTGKPW